MFFRRWASVLFSRGPRSVSVDTDSHLGGPTLTIGGSSGASPCKTSETSRPPRTDSQLSDEDGVATDSHLCGPRSSGVDTDSQGVRAFFNEMMEWMAGEEMLFREISQNYKALSHIRSGWPSVSDKVLSQHLVGLGCKRRKARRGGSRPTLIRFPECDGSKVVSIRRASS
jgi:hypothetical protein